MNKEFEKYEPQRQALQASINHKSLMVNIDRNVFKKTQKEKDQLKEAKLKFKNN
jgi:hypothetical protein